MRSHPALTSLRRIARALWDIRNPPPWVAENRDRAFRKQYVREIADKAKARRARARIVYEARTRGLTFKAVGKLIGTGPQAARNWYRLGVMWQDRDI